MIDSANPTIIYPDGYKPGCLPRRSRPGELCPMAADRIKIVPSSDWAAAAAELGDNLRKHVPVVLDQNGYGSCACEATAGAIMLARAVQGLPFVQLNPLFIYRTTSGGSDSGSSIDDDLAFARDHGCASEAVWPRSNGFRTKPSPEAVEDALKYRIDEFFDIANVNEFVSSELDAWAVVHGAQGHAILAVQHMGTFPLILNSWGQWEDGGFGRWASYNAIQWSYGAFAVRVAS